MFSMLPTPIHTRTQPPHHHHYTPVKPSPLSSSPLRSSPTSPPPLSQRDANVPTSSPTRPSTTCNFNFDFTFNPSNTNPAMSPTPPPKPRTPASNTTTSTRLLTPPATISSSSSSSLRDVSRDGGAFSWRPTKANPLMHRGGPEDGREARRRLFLRRVRDSATEARYGGEEEMMRRIWVAEEKRMEEERRREAAGVGVGLEDVETDDEGGLGGADADDMLVEEVARDELEWEAFLGMVEEQRREVEREREQQQQQQKWDTPYGSDDEEYDDIFMDVILEESRTASQQLQEQQGQHQQPEQEGQGQEHVPDMDMMDMS